MLTVSLNNMIVNVEMIDDKRNILCDEVSLNNITFLLVIIYLFNV